MRQGMFTDFEILCHCFSLILGYDISCQTMTQTLLLLMQYKIQQNWQVTEIEVINQNKDNEKNG